MSTSPTGRRFWRRLPIRLSVRTVMLLVLLVGGAVGWIVQRGRAQRQVVDAIERAGGHVSYGFAWLPHEQESGDWVPDWATKFVDTIGTEYVCDVLEVRLGFLDMRPDRDHEALMVQIGRLHQLRELALYGFEPLTDADVAHLRGLTNLEVLTFDVPLPRAALRHLSGMNKLESLYVRDSPPLRTTSARLAASTDVDLAQLRRLTNLKNLDLTGFHVSGTALWGLSGMSNLRWLVLPGAALRDNDLVHLKQLSKLESLCVHGKAPGITDAGLAHLSGLTNLQDLTLNSCGITSAGLCDVKTLKNLETINLNWANITDIAAFQHFPKLWALSLSHTPVDDAGLAQAFRLSGLTTLDLSYTRVTDAGLPHLRPLKKLTSLTLKGTNTTSEAIAALGKMPLSTGTAGSGENAP